MPITWVEDKASRSATICRLGRKATSSYVKSWKIFGSEDDLEVHSNVNSTLWSSYMSWTYPGQPLNQLQAESYTLEYLGDKAWQLQVTYTKEGAEDDSQENPFKRSRSFDTSGATQHITQALNETSYGGQAPPNMQGAIGVDGDSVNGVDIVVPQLSWTETYDVPWQFVTSAYIKSLSSLTGTVNNGAFRGFAAGEVLFLGASGSHEWDSEKGDGPWTLTYKFQASANCGAGGTFPALQIGGIGNVNKDGHDYLWVRYETTADANTLFKVPKYAYVNQVYRRTGFGELGIGVD